MFTNYVYWMCNNIARTVVYYWFLSTMKVLPDIWHSKYHYMLQYDTAATVLYKSILETLWNLDVDGRLGMGHSHITSFINWFSIYRYQCSIENNMNEWTRLNDWTRLCLSLSANWKLLITFRFQRKLLIVHILFYVSFLSLWKNENDWTNYSHLQKLI